LVFEETPENLKRNSKVKVLGYIASDLRRFNCIEFSHDYAYHFT